MQILIADDDPTVTKMLAHMLSQSGYQVLVAHDGQEALDLLRQSGCQLVITDWEMPRLKGPELCRTIRTGGINGYIYIIMLTSHDRAQDVIAGLAAGADDFVTKPFNPAEIVMRVRTGERLLTLEVSEMTIFAMAKLAESRDPETGAHLERVRSYCKVIADHLQTQPKFHNVVNEGFAGLLYKTSPLHDIGKVAIPDCVLLKPGRLTDEEFAIMKTHTTRGAETLQAASAKYPNAKFLKMARDIALAHHEKFDGRGYPQGLAGEAIPLAARIVTLADVYDALSSKRVYKEAFSHLVTRSIIVQDTGKHFDPDIVAAFLATEQQFIAIRQRYADTLIAAA